MYTRREVLRLGIASAAALCLPRPRALAHGVEVHNYVSPPLTPFVDPLPIPPVLKPVVRKGIEYYTLTMKPGAQKCHRDLPVTSNVLGFDGVFPGPTIRVRKGRPVSVTQVNNLPMSHSGHGGGMMHLPAVHLHGALVAPEHDGHPDDGIPAGGSREYRYPNEQTGCALWYHDHTHGATGLNVYRGLAGLYFIDDPKEKVLRLPGGPYEIPLVIQDRIFRPGGEMIYELDAVTLENGVVGDVILVNGMAQPFLKVATRKYRFRILNGSNARIYKLALSNNAPLIQIGTDGGLLQRPYPQASIECAPSERLDIIVDFSQLPVGEKVTLLNLNGMGRTDSIMQFEVERKEKDNSTVPPFLVPWEELPEDQAVVTREFNLNRQAVNGVLTWVINGQPYPQSAPMAYPKLNTIEKWRFTNPTNHPHPMHLHLVQFQVVNIDGVPQDTSKIGWKDSVVVPPASEVTLLAKFSGFTGRYVFHCHNLEHEDFAMMAEFQVVP
jgi:spore coat protein A